MAYSDPIVRDSLGKFLIESSIGLGISFDNLVHDERLLPFYDLFLDTLMPHQPPIEKSEAAFGKDAIKGKVFYSDPNGDGYWIDGKENIRARLEKTASNNLKPDLFPPCTIS